MKNDESASEMTGLQRLVAIFSAPTKAFASINRKPTFAFPIIFAICAVTALQLLTLDVQLSDRLLELKASGASEQRIAEGEATLAGPVKYLGIVLTPIIAPIIFAVLAWIYMVACNKYFGKKVAFNIIFSMVLWASMVALVDLVPATWYALTKGTLHGYATDLSILLPTPALGEGKSILYRFLAKFSIFTIWQLVLLIIGFAIAYGSTTAKASRPVLALWALWIAISVPLGKLFEGLAM
ncbi:MAG: YIP1 family protein [Deferribacteres bacterium]|nr:YIP1 family protein [Deferribacteres bacterium]